MKRRAYPTHTFTNLPTSYFSKSVIFKHKTCTYYKLFNTILKTHSLILQIGKGNRLLIIVQDINLDPDGRDKFTMTHKYRKLRKSKKVGSSAFTRLSHQRRVVMTTKAARSGVSVEVSEGRLVIHFRPFRRSKGGRGFVLVFKSKLGVLFFFFKLINVVQKIRKYKINTLRL